MYISLGQESSTPNQGSTQPVSTKQKLTLFAMMVGIGIIAYFGLRPKKFYGSAYLRSKKYRRHVEKLPLP